MKRGFSKRARRLGVLAESWSPPKIGRLEFIALPGIAARVPKLSAGIITTQSSALATPSGPNE